MKTHVLKITTGDGSTERKVDGQDRFMVKVGADIKSWPAHELALVQIEQGFSDEHVVLLVVHAVRGGSYVPLVRGARITLGDDEWAAHDIVSFMLAPIPEPVKEPEPRLSRTFRLVFTDGSEETVQVLGAAELRGSLDPSVPLTKDSNWGYDLERIVSLERVEEGVPA